MFENSFRKDYPIISHLGLGLAVLRVATEMLIQERFLLQEGKTQVTPCCSQGTSSCAVEELLMGDVLTTYVGVLTTQKKRT